MTWPPSTRSGARNAVAASFRSSRSPPVTDRSLRGRSDSYYFVLRERPFGSIPGDVLAGLLISVAAQVPRPDPSRARVSSSFLRRWVRCLRRISLFVLLGRRVDRSPRASPGRGSALDGARCGARWRVPAQACAAQPLENSKASTSIFVLQATKSQR